MSVKAEKTKEKILDTALRHFLKDGFSGASLRNIVKDAGLTTGAFYKYYPTKEMLFDALTDPYVEHIYEIYDGILADFFFSFMQTHSLTIILLRQSKLVLANLSIINKMAHRHKPPYFIF